MKRVSKIYNTFTIINYSIDFIIFRLNYEIYFFVDYLKPISCKGGERCESEKE